MYFTLKNIFKKLCNAAVETDLWKMTLSESSILLKHTSLRKKRRIRRAELCQVTVFLILQGFCSGRDSHTTTTCWMRILQCRMIVTLQVKISLLMTFFFFFFPCCHLWFLCYSCLQVKLKNLPALSPWRQKDQCCATLPAAHLPRCQSRLVMMQCEGTESYARVASTENDRFIFLCDAGFHSTWQRFRGR